VSRKSGLQLELWDNEEVLQSPIIPVEPNLEEAPLFTIKGRYREEGVAEARSTIMTPDGRRLEQLWRVSASRDYDLPGAFDQDVFVALHRLLQRRGGMPPDGKVRFSLYELIEIMGKPKKGQSYQDVRDSLVRMASTTIHSKNALYRGDTESYENETFSLWRVHFSANRDKRGRGTEHHTLTFDEIVRRSFEANYLKALDTDFYFSLASPMARRLYRLVDQKRGEKLSWSVSLGRLRQLVSMAPVYKYPSQIKQALKPAHRELLKKGFLKEAAFSDDGTPSARYRIAADFARTRSSLELPQTPLRTVAVQKLVQSGAWENVANVLVDRFGPEHCLHYVEALAVQKGVENPGAWLKSYIENGWPVPIPPAPQDVTSREPLPEPFERRLASPPGTQAPPDAPDPEEASGAEDEKEIPQPFSEEIQRRREAGEFAEALETFETLPGKEYAKFLGHDVRHTDGNRYHLSMNGELYVYAGGRDPEHRYYLLTLDRSS
jgi:hypothetical protein